MDLLDEVILHAYSNLPKPTRNYITKVIYDGVPYIYERKVDDKRPEVYVSVRGTLRRLLSVLRPDITILSVDMTSPSSKRFVTLFQEIRKSCPHLNVLKIGYSVSNPIRLDKKNEKKFCKAITALVNDCPELQHIDVRDILLTRPVYSVFCDLFELKSMSATLLWDDIAPIPTDTVCKDKLVHKIGYIRTLDLMDFKQYARRYRGPTVPEMRALTVPREGIMCGLSAKLDTPDIDWVFNCVKLKYLDLEVTKSTLLKPDAAKFWNELIKLTHLKLVASGGAKGVPPLKKVDTLTHLVLDSSPEEGDWGCWYKKNMPDSLEFGAFFSVKRLQRDMFEVIGDTTPVLKALYVGYAENNPDPMLCPASRPPAQLRHVMILKDNDISTKNDHHAMGALYMKKKYDNLIFKLDSFERPRNDRMKVVWKDFWRRLEWMRTRQVILDWRIDALRKDMFDFIDCNDVTDDMLREHADSEEEEDDEEGGEEGVDDDGSDDD